MKDKRGQSPTTFLMKNRRGAELSTNTIILLIIGVIILVVLVLGFILGWDTIAPWLFPSNVNTIVTQCQASCTTGDIYAYCGLERTLNAPDNKGVKGNCTYFSEKADYLKYGVAKCPGLCPVTTPNP